MKYPKHLIVIKNKSYNLGNDIVIEEDLDILYQTANFSFPYYDNNKQGLKIFNRYDNVQIYFKFFDTAAERENATVDDLQRIFTGYINRMEVSQNKSGGYNYNLYCRSTAAFAYEISDITKIQSNYMKKIIEDSITDSELSKYITNVDSTGWSDDFVIQVTPELYIGKVFDQIKSDYAIHIFQSGDGTLNIRSPFYLIKQDEGTNTKVYDLTKNVFSISYGEITNDVETVVVVGAVAGAVGVAFDPISYQLKTGVPKEELKSTVVPIPTLQNPLWIMRRDLLNSVDCQLAAQNKIVELAKNYQISFDCEYDPSVMISTPFLINNSAIISNRQQWITKKRTINISKSNIKCTITGYSNSVTDIPDKYTIGTLGILSTNYLKIEQKTRSALDLGGERNG